MLDLASKHDTVIVESGGATVSIRSTGPSMRRERLQHWWRILFDAGKTQEMKFRPSFRRAAQLEYVRLAAFQNPEFYTAQALRLSTYDTPRIIACAEDFPAHIGLPRGCLEELVRMLGDLGINPTLRDERYGGKSLAATFQGELRPEQKTAADVLIAHDTGVLAATTVFAVNGSQLIRYRCRKSL